jgi:adenylyltransferase/sulfurtransferase
MNEFRYEKQIILKGFGLPAQQLLQDSKVLIIGAGGLGTPCAQYLNGAGVGTIGLIDDDRISLNNLPRQTLFDEAEVGLLKVNVLSQKLAKQNPATKFICYNEFLTPANALDIISCYDVVVDASDNFATRYLVNDSCVILNKPFVYGAVHEFEGQVSVLNFQDGPTYRCLFPCDAALDIIPNCNENGIIGALPALIGTYQAIETIKTITGVGKPLSGHLLIIDTLTQSHFKIAVTVDPANKKTTRLKESYLTPVCNNEIQIIDATTFKNWLQVKKQLQLIDVRTEVEFRNQSWPATRNIPLTELGTRQSEINFNVPVITICETGVRSKNAALLLKNNDSLRQVFSLQGGLRSLL